MAVRIQGLKGRHMTAQGNALGFDAIIAIKRCKRATILALTRQHPNVVAQASQPAVGKPSFGSQVSKPACRGLPETDANVDAPCKPLASSASVRKADFPCVWSGHRAIFTRDPHACDPPDQRPDLRPRVRRLARIYFPHQRSGPKRDKLKVRYQAMGKFIHVRSKKFPILPGEKEELVNEGLHIMKISHPLSLALGLCLLTGCTTTPKTYSQVLAGMSRNNLRFWFGEPLRIEHLASGGEDWYYHFSSWQSKPVGEAVPKDEFGQPNSVSAGLEFSQQVVESPVRLSPDGFVVPPVPAGKVVKN